MVKRVKNLITFINKEFSGLHQAAFLLGFSALGSQVLALVRDRLLASSFGAGQTLDVYYAAFRIPDLVYVTIASFISITVLIPFIIDKVEKDEHAAARKFLDEVFTVFCLVMIVVSAILFFLIPYLTKLMTPGFSPEAQKQLVLFSRVLLFSPFLLGVSNLLGSVTQSLQKFFIYALSPILYNLGIILGVLIFYPVMGPAGLVWGVVFGAVMHVGVQIPTLLSRNFLPKLTTRINFKDLKKVVGVSLPRTISLAASQLSIIVLVSLASFMKAGSIAVFNFSYNLQSVPLAIVGVSYSVAAFPLLTRHFAKGETDKFLRQIADAIKHIAFWSFISAVLFIVLRAQIVRVILGAGRFSWSDTRLTAACLAIFAVSVVAQSLCLLFVRAYYAAGKTKKPLFINVASAGVVVVLAFLLTKLYGSSLFFRYWLESMLRVDDLPGTAILILPLAFSIGSILNAAAHWFYFEIDFGRLPGQVVKSCLQTLSASLIGGALTYESLNVLDKVFDIKTVFGIFSQGFLAGVVGLIGFVIILKLLGNAEIEAVGQALWSKFWKAKAVAPEQEIL